jgi:hypothetical protein
MKLSLKTGAATLAIFATAQAAHAESRDWWLDLEAGAEYDDNVAIDQNDTNRGEGDAAATFEVDAGYKLVDTDTSRVEVGYNFYQSVYRDATDFNYQSHMPSLTAWSKVDGIKFGFSYSYLHSLLDNAFFLDEHIFAPSVSAYLGDNFYVTATYRYLDKNYNRIDNARDAQTHQPGADAYYYFDKANKGYFSVGGSYASEDTRSAEFDYSGFVGRASVQFPIEAFDRKGHLKLSYAYQKRDYDNDISLLPGNDGVKRSDNRHTFRAYGDFGLTDNLKVVAEYRFIMRNSNLATADYDENVASLGLRYSF